MEDEVFAGTGHRPEELGGHGTETLVKLTDYAVSIIPSYKVTKLISGMALGWDQAIALAAIELKLPWIACIPFLGQESIWPEESKIFYQSLLKQANEVVIVCEGGYAPWKMQKRNEWMVDHSTAVLALWNGNDGGTANCVAYAKKVHRPIYNVWPGWESLQAAA